MENKNLVKVGLGLGVAAVVLFVAGNAIAGGGFGAVGENVADQSKGMAAGAKNIGYLLGLIFVIIGLAVAANAKKSNTPMAIPFTFIIVGVCLLALTAFISTGSETIFGSDETSSAQSTLSLE